MQACACSACACLRFLTLVALCFSVKTKGPCSLILLLLFSSPVSAQIYSSLPEKFIIATDLDMLGGMDGPKLSHNHPEQIYTELLDENLISRIAKRTGLTKADLATIAIAQRAGGHGLELYQLRRPDKAFKVLEPQLRNYVSARRSGHTKEFMLAGLTNITSLLLISDPDMRVLSVQKPFLPISQVVEVGSGTSTNSAGEVASMSTTTTIVNGRFQTSSVTNRPKADQIHRWSSYRITDGDITWVYTLNFKPNAELQHIQEERRDAKDFDPKFQKTFKEVDDELIAQMKKEGTYGRLGSIRWFWDRKKTQLEGKGIQWRSPQELNPQTRYD